MEAKVVVVTGASSGIGSALCRSLAFKGHTVVLAARREEELEKVANAIDQRTLVVPTDVTDRQAVQNLLARSVEAFGHVDVWINNAGRGITKRVLDLDDHDIDDMVQVNLKSALYGMQVAVPHFIDRGSGHLINVSSFLAKMPMAPMRSAYSAAKAALNSLSDTLRFDLGSAYPNIHISVVMPGLVATDFARNASGKPAPQMPPPKNVPPPQSAEEVAKVIVDLIADPREEVFTNPASVQLLERWRR